MKYILLPIHPEWCEKILNGEKTIEVRKGTTLHKVINNLIKEQGKAPCLIYCTKGSPYLYDLFNQRYSLNKIKPPDSLNGKVVAEFEASAEVIESNQFSIRFTKTLNASELEERSCLTQTKIAHYLVDNDASPVLGTAIHIHNLKIFDEPKTLWRMRLFSRFKKEKDIGSYGLFASTQITKAPQSWCYVEINQRTE